MPATRHGCLVREEQARLRAVPDLIILLVERDPELSAVHETLPAVLDPALVDPLLRTVEVDAVRRELGRTDEAVEGPLPFFARLVTGGTLDAVLRTIDLVITDLGAVAVAD